MKTEQKEKIFCQFLRLIIGLFHISQSFFSHSLFHFHSFKYVWSNGIMMMAGEKEKEVAIYVKQIHFFFSSWKRKETSKNSKKAFCQKKRNERRRRRRNVTLFVWFIFMLLWHISDPEVSWDDTKTQRKGKLSQFYFLWKEMGIMP